MSVVTISRLDACRGEEVAAEVARRLGYRLVDRVLMKDLIYSYDLLASLGKLESPEPEEEEKIREVTEGIIRHLAYRENIVLLGHGGQFLFRNWPSTFHVRIIAGMEHRLRHFSGVGKGDRSTELLRGERKRQRLVRKYSGRDLTLPEHYDLVVRMDGLGVDEAAKIIAGGVTGRQWPGGGDPGEISSYGSLRGLEEIVLDPLPANRGGEAAFAHPSEAEFARVLDFYQIRWEYEPTTFPIRWASDGTVLESFSPDFYLPDMDVYLELTTMKQALVTKKNRKVRLFREIYPDKTLNIFYGRDYRKLAFKYGLE
jgi:cytidylate kinase